MDMEALDRREPADTFRALCRSSPWRWESLRFEVYRSAGNTEDAGVRAWLRRPGGLRVETLDGRLLHSTTGINDSRDDLYISATRKSWLLPPRLVTPVYNNLGLVRRRPEAAYGEPEFGGPRWTSMLDPVELAGKSPVPVDAPQANAVDVEAVTEVEDEGRRTLAATVTPLRGYVPRDPDFPLAGPGRTEVRIDWQTGVCVAARPLDSDAEGAAARGHRLRILGVDEYMLDDLFVEVSMHLTDVREHIPWIA